MRQLFQDKAGLEYLQQTFYSVVIKDVAQGCTNKHLIQKSFIYSNFELIQFNYYPFHKVVIEFIF